MAKRVPRAVLAYLILAMVLIAILVFACVVLLVLLTLPKEALQQALDSLALPVDSERRELIVLHLLLLAVSAGKFCLCLKPNRRKVEKRKGLCLFISWN